ncbi:hypothetical protein PFLUV_G00220550 [Perca fluviatilis]|uniref:Uncharacterized protein n=1 Tax=Perca fluviatilis TaxID=8168 RepID=A0A6A5EN83_PERFL|nr:hypothetical protein PFLUV_G00220550 [Perca fluviatilis]
MEDATKFRRLQSSQERKVYAVTTRLPGAPQGTGGALASLLASASWGKARQQLVEKLAAPKTTKGLHHLYRRQDEWCCERRTHEA